MLWNVSFWECFAKFSAVCWWIGDKNKAHLLLVFSVWGVVCFIKWWFQSWNPEEERWVTVGEFISWEVDRFLSRLWNDCLLQSEFSFRQVGSQNECWQFLLWLMSALSKLCCRVCQVHSALEMCQLEGVLVQIEANNIFLLSMGGIPFLLGMFISCSLTSDVIGWHNSKFYWKRNYCFGFFSVVPLNQICLF